MSEVEYRDRQELETEVKDYSKQIETLGEEQKDHQEDLERLREKLRILKSSKGVYAQSDSKLNRAVEDAIATRERSVETCKEKIGDVKNQMESKLENLGRVIKKTEERVTKMEEVVDSLNHNQEQVINNIKIDIQQGKDDIEDAKDKGNALKKVIEVAIALLTAGGMAASGIAQLVNSLQNAGLFR